MVRKKNDNKIKKTVKEVVGRVQMTRDGYLFVIVDGEEDDVFVKQAKTRGALNGDIVRVAIRKEKTDKSRREGDVVEIVERNPKPFVGVLKIVGNQAWVLVQSRFMPYDIVIPFDATGYEPVSGKRSVGFIKRMEDDSLRVRGVFEMHENGKSEMYVEDGMKVAAVVDGWDRNEPMPHGHIVDVLGMPGENDTEMHAILAEYALPYRFEPEVANAADAISDEITEQDLSERRDFRDVLTITIDPADAKDFDDAISFRRLDNGNYEVGVHIADVTHYVSRGTVVDEEARKRGTSVYLVDRTVPMLPEKLSNKLCSLRPNEPKLTFSAVFEMTALGRVVDQWFGRTVISSDYRFAYETAQQIIDAGEKAMTMELKGGTDGKHGTIADPVLVASPEAAEERRRKMDAGSEAAMGEGVTEGCVIPDDCKEAVLILHKLATKLRKKRFASGAISFERPEMKVEVDEKGKPVNVYQKVTKEANWLVEEFMLLANRSVAEFVATKCKPAGKRDAKTFVYRIHEEPNQEKLENLRHFIANFGYKMGPTNNGKEISKELNGLFDAARNTPEFNAIELLSLRTMSKAKYSTDNAGHYGLAFKYYTHFTSPIRRYPDMMVHRLLAKYLAGGESSKKDVYEGMCKYASEREIVAADAERASIKYKLVEFMQEKVGFEFDGHISGLTDWGMYVEVEPTKIEGMVALRDIESDFFEFDQTNYRLVGRYTHKVYNLGDPVRIRVKKTDLEQKLLDYELVEIGVTSKLDRRQDYESARGNAFQKGVDGPFDKAMKPRAVGANKDARKEKVRQAIKASKKKSAASKKKSSAKPAAGSKKRR